MELKAMIEKRNVKLEEMKDILEAVKIETRAFTEEEEGKYSGFKEEIRVFDETIKALEEVGKLEKRDLPTDKSKESIEEVETRSFENYIRGQMGETRTGEQNVSMGNNGAVIPSTIAQRIIKEVRDICPILDKAEIYNVKGTLKVPVWSKVDSTHDIAVGYQVEFTELTADAGKFTSVDLGGFLVGALTLIGKSVINNAGVDVVGFIVTHMSEKIAEFIEKELLMGSGIKAAQGITSTTNVKAAASSSVITADELIDLQAMIKQAYQNNACWIMNSDTYTAVKKLKDSGGRYLLQDDITGGIPFRLLGKPVYLSDNMPTIAAGAKVVLYGNLSALSVNFRENIEIQMLLEKYATEHAVGCVAWFEFDAKVTNNQKVAVLKMATA